MEKIDEYLVYKYIITGLASLSVFHFLQSGYEILILSNRIGKEDRLYLLSFLSSSTSS